MLYAVVLELVPLTSLENLLMKSPMGIVQTLIACTGPDEIIGTPSHMSFT